MSQTKQYRDRKTYSPMVTKGLQNKDVMISYREQLQTQRISDHFACGGNLDTSDVVVNEWLELERLLSFQKHSNK